MSTEVSTQKAASGLTFQVPAHIAARIKASGGGNIAEKSTVNQLTFGGKTWAMHINGEKKILQRPNDDGDMEKIQILKVIVLDYAKQRGRSYYVGNFDPNNVKAPDCWSNDGRKPHSSVENPQCGTCETCPMSAKGSKVVDGKSLTACSQNRTLVVIPAANQDFPAMRLKIAVTSDWDKQDEESSAAGWLGWSNYTDLLRANGLDHTGALVTRMRFADVNYPKIQFARGDFLEEAQFEKIVARSKSDEVVKLMEGYTPNAAPAPKQSEASKIAEQSSKLAKAQADEADREAREAEDKRLQIEEGERIAAALAAKDAAEKEQHASAAALIADKAQKVAEMKAALAALEAETAHTSELPPATVVSYVGTSADEAEKVKRHRRTKAEMEAARAAEANRAAKAASAAEADKPVIKEATSVVATSETPPPRVNAPQVVAPSVPVEAPASLSAILDDPNWS